MRTALLLLLIHGCLGAVDTLFYHEYRLRLPCHLVAQRELRLHACRDFVAAVIAGSLAWLTWNGLWAWVLMALCLSVIGLTLGDFIQEARTRTVPAGEWALHAVMALVYGGVLAELLPEGIRWATLPTGFQMQSYGLWSDLLTATAVGVFISGLPDMVPSSMGTNPEPLVQRKRA
jgi:hypothetical protein